LFYISLSDLHARHYGLTPGVAAAYAEAAAVCLSRHHTSPRALSITRPSATEDAVVSWQAPSHRERAAWANDTDATEAAGYACVIAAAEKALNLFAVRRAETATGADYYLGPPGTGVDDIEECLRLEVSGVDRGTYADVARRLSSKCRQAMDGNSSLPALAGVVGFEAACVAFSDILDAA
jgi:hypothetical protein